jgi:hypothetical protein
MNKKHLKVKKIIVPVLTAYMVLLAAGNTTALALTETDLADMVSEQETFNIEYVDSIKSELPEGINWHKVIFEGSPNVLNITDIASHWAGEDILFIVEKGGIKGYADHTFRPNNNISAAELASILIGASGNDNTVPSGNWANGIMEKARSLGITDIQNENGSKPISRELMADMLMRSAERLYNTYTDVNTANMSNAITDYNNIKSEYKENVLKCYKIGLLEGQADGKYNPSDNTTRAEAATICARLLNGYKRKHFRYIPADLGETSMNVEGMIFSNARPVDKWGNVRDIPWIGDTITVKGKTYLIERDLATGVIGLGIPTALFAGYVFPETGWEIKGGAIGGGTLIHNDYMGNVYSVDVRTGEAHFTDEWMYIQLSIGLKIKEENGGKYPVDGSSYDIFGNKITAESNTVPYVTCNPDGPTWHGARF